MPLLAFWSSNPDAVNQLSIEQIVANAGDGVLKDQSVCSLELRSYLGQVATAKIDRYIDHCLSSSFSKSGMVLQDLVNKLGRRLDYSVTNGRYQGTSNAIGFDGVWTAPEDHTLIVEVKTTDTYRLSLDTLAVYRQKLDASGQLGVSSPILIVVGREDTGELEAQIRGSKHAWDVRLISAEALIKLVMLKEEAEATETGLKIRSLFMLAEYTRLDRMVDVVFTTVRDVEEPEGSIAPAEAREKVTVTPSSIIASGSGSYQFTDKHALQAKREQVVEALGKREAIRFVRKSRAMYWTSGHDVRATCSISKRYTGKNQAPYWYAYHPQWDEFLQQATRSFFVMGCMDHDMAFAVPRIEMERLLPQLNTTTRENSTYWHLHLTGELDRLMIIIPKSAQGFDLTPYRIRLTSE